MIYIKTIGPFPPEVKPARPGLYRQVQYGGGYAYWNGDAWSVARLMLDEAWRSRGTISQYQNRPWIGVATEPQE